MSPLGPPIRLRGLHSKGAAYARLIAARGAAVVVHDAGVAPDGSGFDPSVADGVVAEITEAGGIAAASDLITFDTPSSGNLPYGLLGDHAYMFESLTEDAQQVVLRL
jgi:hypothetical protein